MGISQPLKLYFASERIRLGDDKVDIPDTADLPVPVGLVVLGVEDGATAAGVVFVGLEVTTTVAGGGTTVVVVVLL